MSMSRKIPIMRKNRHIRRSCTHVHVGGAVNIIRYLFCYLFLEALVGVDTIDLRGLGKEGSKGQCESQRE